MNKTPIRSHACSHNLCTSSPSPRAPQPETLPALHQFILPSSFCFCLALQPQLLQRRWLAAAGTAAVIPSAAFAEPIGNRQRGQAHTPQVERGITTIAGHQGATLATYCTWGTFAIGGWCACCARHRRLRVLYVNALILRQRILLIPCIQLLLYVLLIRLLSL